MFIVPELILSLYFIGLKLAVSLKVFEEPYDFLYLISFSNLDELSDV
jgi:hypothetical protein